MNAANRYPTGNERKIPKYLKKASGKEKSKKMKDRRKLLFYFYYYYYYSIMIVTTLPLKLTVHSVLQLNAPWHPGQTLFNGSPPN